MERSIESCSCPRPLPVGWYLTVGEQIRREVPLASVWKNGQDDRFRWASARDPHRCGEVQSGAGSNGEPERVKSSSGLERVLVLDLDVLEAFELLGPEDLRHVLDDARDATREAGGLDVTEALSRNTTGPRTW